MPRPANQSNHDPDAVLDAYLVVQAQTGDRGALAVLVRRWRSRVQVYAMRLSADRSMAEDVSQDTWLSVARGLSRLDDPARFRAWLYSIVRRRAADSIRARRRARRDRTDRASPTTVEHRTENPIDEALAAISPDDRELLTLRHIDELGVTELAEVFGVPSGTIKSRLHAARERLRAAIAASNTERSEP